MKSIFRTLLLLIITLFAGQVSAEVVVQDALGNTVRLSQPAKRIISLAPHNTENLFAAGAGMQLVGATQYSDYPEAAKRVPRVGGYTGLDLETIIALKPDLILAWDSGNRKEDIERLRSLGFIIYMSEPHQLEDIATEIEALGTLAGTTQTARQFANQFRDQLQQLRQRHHKLKPVRVFYEIWHRPLMTINGEQLISKALALCGGNNVFAGLSTLAAAIDTEAVLAANPDTIITSAKSAKQNREWIENWRRWPQLRAVAYGNLYFVPPDLLQRQGPRILQGIEQLCEAVAQARRKIDTLSKQ
ncbi:MAG TPA: cobalamin-binding protein [Gammaproteobacteria bacterium]|nr:cobalamin-binding protein [Gammaproteobacteria bacterium]